MTKEEIKEFLDDTKVYVNGKSKEIQEKLFSFGYRWNCSKPTTVSNVNKPFLFIYEDREITYSIDMDSFAKHKNREISAEEILSIEVTEPSYRPFKSQEECWNEMLKHQPFGWVIDKNDNSYEHIEDLNIYTRFSKIFEEYTFVDGTPFGILEK